MSADTAQVDLDSALELLRNVFGGGYANSSSNVEEFGRYFARHRIASTIPKDEAIRELVAGIIKLQGAITDLINDSEGVYGLHLNGDPAPWVELTLGGRFEEWIGLPLDEADALIAKHGKVKP